MTERVTLPIEAGGELELDPLGNHLMLVGLGDPLTVGERFDVTRERIRQIQLTALAKIKSSPHAASLRDLLD